VSYLHDQYRPRGLPTWTLWAAIPVVTALGFVFGMALAVYLPEELPRTVTTAPPTVQPEPPAQAPDTPPAQTDSSWQIVTTPTPGTSGATLPTDGPLTEGATAPGSTPPEPFTGTAHDIREARKALQYSFGRYEADGISFAVEYQAMRQAERGTSLVGIVLVADYANWERTLRETPDKLQQWLEAAVARVQEAAVADRFHTAWAVVEVLREDPPGFATNEVTPLTNRSFLVVRPLAATRDHTKTEVAVRPLASLADSVSGRLVSERSPWALYGPVIRFDTTDIYRPDRARDARPAQ